LSYGFVLESTFMPAEWGKVSFTADWWRIEQENVVGIFGDDNHILLDYVLRLNGGSNSAVVRAAPDADDIAAFAGTGIAPVGDILFVNDNYLNLDKRTVQGLDRASTTISTTRRSVTSLSALTRRCSTSSFRACRRMARSSTLPWRRATSQPCLAPTGRAT